MNTGPTRSMVTQIPDLAPVVLLIDRNCSSTSTRTQVGLLTPPSQPDIDADSSVTRIPVTLVDNLDVSH